MATQHPEATQVEDSSPSRSMVFPGRMVLGLGILGLVRFLPEMVGLGVPTGGFYLRLVLLDVSCAILAVVGGIGIVRGHAWGSEVACSALGSQVSLSILWLFHFLSAAGINAEIVPRLIFYGTTLLFSPFLAIRLVAGAKAQTHPAQVSERFSRILTLILSAVVGITATVIIRLLD